MEPDRTDEAWELVLGIRNGFAPPPMLFCDRTELIRCMGSGTWRRLGLLCMARALAWTRDYYFSNCFACRRLLAVKSYDGPPPDYYSNIDMPRGRL